jgi:GAF domain-containing protein/HAMP domain-containing protein
MMNLFKTLGNLNLGLKLSGLVAVMLAIMLTIMTAIAVGNIGDLTTRTGQQRVEQEALVVQSQFDEVQQEVLSASKLLAGTPGLVDVVANRDETGIRIAVLVGAAPFDFDDISVVDADGMRLVVFPETGGARDIEQEDTLFSFALLGIENADIIIGKEGEPGLRLAAAVPLRDSSGALVGAVLASRWIDDQFLDEINFSREDIHLAIVTGERIAAQDFATMEQLEEFSPALLDNGAIEGALGGQTLVAENLLYSADGRPYTLAHTPLTVRGDPRAIIGIVADLGELSAFQRQLTNSTILVFAFSALALLLVVVLYVWRIISIRLGRLQSAAEQMASGDYGQRVEVTTMDEIGQLSGAFNSMADQLVELISGLEQRTADLQWRTTQLQTSAEVSHTIASIMDIDQLIYQVVELIHKQFDLYYVGLFLVDPSGEWAVLRAGSGKAGQAMVARGHRLQVGQGLVGTSIAGAEPCIALDTGEDEVHLATAELPDTRSEAALPLRSRGQTIGALTVQSDRSAVFDQETIAVWQMMADQLAVALDNAQLLAARQAALEAERRAYGEISRQAWAEWAHTRIDWGYDYEQKSLTPAHGGWSPEMQKAAQTGQKVLAMADEAAGNGDGGKVLALPLKVRDLVVGVLSVRKEETGQAWTTEEMELLETLTGQLEVALESARLYEDSRRREVQERLVGEVTSRIRETLDMDTVLQTAVREIGESLGLHDLTIQLEIDEDGA